MDVHCTTCGEPWDVYHLMHEAIFDTGLSHEEAEAWRTLPQARKLNNRYRKEFRAAGWQFGQSIVNVVRCPCCPRDARPNAERLHIKAALEEALAEDEDSLVATFEDYDL